MLKKYFKILAAVIAALMMMTALAGCSGGGTVTKPTMGEGAVAVDVTGSCDIAIHDGVITVSGETNLLTGCILCISVESQAGITLDSVKMTKGDDDKVSHDFVISDDKYDDSVTAVIGHITCAPKLYGKHADIVYETYGNKFENINMPDGGLIWNTSGNIVVFASEMVNLER